MKNLLEVEGNYFSTYAFVQQNNLENTSDKVLGKGWVAEDDVNQIQQIIDYLNIGNYSVEFIEGKSEDDIQVRKVSDVNVKVYGIDSDKINDHLELLALQDHSLTDEQFIEISEKCGLIWSIDGFSHAYNINEISNSTYIRII
jgi:hypothetical protein